MASLGRQIREPQGAQRHEPGFNFESYPILMTRCKGGLLSDDSDMTRAISRKSEVVNHPDAENGRVQEREGRG